jgi:uncharacterized protein (TIGR02996 family)
MEYELPFIQEIRANPRDDIPRLIYADYLDEAGDPRGEFIRTQVRLAKLPVGHEDRAALMRREEELLNELAEEWLAPLRQLGAAGVSRRCFHRGLIERITLPTETFVDAGRLREMCRISPGLHSVQLREAAVGLPVLLALDLPAQITSLDFSGNRLAADDAADLAAAGWREQIVELDLHFNQLDDNVGRLWSIPWPKLQRLQLGVNRLGPEALRRWDEALGVNRIGDQGWQRLLTAPMSTQLVELDVSCNGITGEGVNALSQAALPKLERLILRGNPLVTRGQEKELPDLAGAPALQYLDVRSAGCQVALELRQRLGEGLRA